jgi:hypothetical protein
MRAAYDEIATTAIKRQHEPQRVIGDLHAAEIAEKQARSIKYQLAIANGMQCPSRRQVPLMSYSAMSMPESALTVSPRRP